VLPDLLENLPHLLFEGGKPRRRRLLELPEEQAHPKAEKALPGIGIKGVLRIGVAALRTPVLLVGLVEGGLKRLVHRVDLRSIRRLDTRQTEKIRRRGGRKVGRLEDLRDPPVDGERFLVRLQVSLPDPRDLLETRDAAGCGIPQPAGEAVLLGLGVGDDLLLHVQGLFDGLEFLFRCLDGLEGRLHLEEPPPDVTQGRFRQQVAVIDVAPHQMRPDPELVLFHCRRLFGQLAEIPGFNPVESDRGEILLDGRGHDLEILIRVPHVALREVADGHVDLPVVGLAPLARVEKGVAARRVEILKGGGVKDVRQFRGRIDGNLHPGGVEAPCAALHLQGVAVQGPVEGRDELTVLLGLEHEGAHLVGCIARQQGTRPNRMDEPQDFEPGEGHSLPKTLGVDLAALGVLDIRHGQAVENETGRGEGGVDRLAETLALFLFRDGGIQRHPVHAPQGKGSLEGQGGGSRLLRLLDEPLEDRPVVLRGRFLQGLSDG